MWRGHAGLVAAGHGPDRSAPTSPPAATLPRIRPGSPACRPRGAILLSELQSCIPAIQTVGEVLDGGWRLRRCRCWKNGETWERFRLGARSGVEASTAHSGGCAMNLAGSSNEDRPPSRHGERRRDWGGMDCRAAGCDYGDRAFSSREYCSRSIRRSLSRSLLRTGSATSSKMRPYSARVSRQKRWR